MKSAWLLILVKGLLRLRLHRGLAVFRPWRCGSHTDHKWVWFGSLLMNRQWSRGTKLAKMCYSVGEGGWQTDRFLSDTSLSQSSLKEYKVAYKDATYLFSACLKSISVRTEIWVPKAFRKIILSLQLAGWFQYRDPLLSRGFLTTFRMWHWCETAVGPVLHC